MLENARRKRSTPRPPRLLHFLRFPPPNFFFSIEKVRSVGSAAAQQQKRRGGRWFSAMIKLWKQINIRKLTNHELL